MEGNVLSNQEVEALLNASKDKLHDLDKLMGSGLPVIDNIKLNTMALNSIIDMLRLELEKNLSAFLRKKIFIKSKSNDIKTASQCFGGENDKSIYTALRLMPHECYGIINLDLSLLHQLINLLYGAKINPSESLIEGPGKIGLLVGEKITAIFMDCFSLACSDFGTLNYELLKTTSSLPLAYNYGIEQEDNIYLMEYTFLLDEFENTIKFGISEDFLEKFVSKKTDPTKVRQKDFWREAIKTQVVDSMVNINVCLPEVTMKVSDFMNLKEGDQIPISDPTKAFLCLSNYKLFRAQAGQASSRLMVKIVEQI